MRVLITEEALQSGNGHWPGYIGGIAGGMRKAGDEVEVLIHRQATAKVEAEVGGRPWFSKNCWVEAASQGALGGIRHNFIFGSELANWLRSKPPYDWVCALTMRLQHLLAFALLSRSRRLPGSTRILLLFVQGFGNYAGPDKPTSFPINGSTLLARFCFRLLAPDVRRGRVMLAVETNGMQDELQRFTGLPVVLFPHPVPPPYSQHGTGDSGQNTRARRQEQSTKSKKPTITITCPGFARHEKGNDLLQEAVKRILVGPTADHLHFVMQWPEPFPMPDGSTLGPDPALACDPRVEFLNQNLDAGAYEGLLARTDLVVLPYRRSSYHHRVSRVAIEAASRGIPLVYTSGTWTEEIAELAGCGVAISEETPEAVEHALMTAIGQFETMFRVARDSSSNVALYHSAERFRSLLLEKM